MMKNIKNNTLTVIISVLVLIVLIYLLRDFNNSIEPFTQSKEEQLRQHYQDSNNTGLNQVLERIDNQLNTHVNTMSDSEIMRIQQQGLNSKINDYHDKINDYDFSLGEGSMNKLDELNNEINYLDNEITRKNLRERLNTDYKGIKSHNNGLEIKI